MISIQRERGREGTLLEMLNQKPKEKNGKNERNLKKKILKNLSQKQAHSRHHTHARARKERTNSKDTNRRPLCRFLLFVSFERDCAETSNEERKKEKRKEKSLFVRVLPPCCWFVSQRWKEARRFEIRR